MKIIVCGDRHWDDFDIIWRILQTYYVEHGADITIIHGDCKGADKLAETAAESFKFEVVAVPADWNFYGRAAGPIRNKEMLDMEPDIVLAFHQRLWDSKGTKNMVEIAKKAGVPTRVITGVGKEWLE